MAETPFEAPRKDDAAPDPSDPGAARPGFAVGVLGFVIVVAGLFAALVWPQLLVFGLRVTTFMKVVPPVITLAGVAVIPLGAMVASGRFVAAVLVTPLLVFATLLQIVWAVWAATHGALSLLYPFGVVAGGIGILCGLVAIPLTKRIHDARKALLAD